jgi:ppGpp synthetase/RelA/SpoT-type nucleotidyltranferase
VDGLEPDPLGKDCRECAHRAGLFHDWLKGLLEQSGARKGAYAFTDRKKPWGDIRDKVKRKRNEGRADYDPSAVTDASGFRIVTLFHDQLVEVCQQLLDLIQVLKNNPDEDGGLEREPIPEIIYYRSMRPLDPSSIGHALRKVVRDHPLNIGKFDEEELSYSSIHVIVNGYTGSGQDKVPASSEIQLRSVFEDAWSQISHKLDYSPDKKQRSEATIAEAEPQVLSWRRHFDALKAFCDGCTQYASLIRRDSPKRGDGSGTRQPTPLEPAGTLVGLFGACSAAVQQAVRQAWNARNRADKEKTSSSGELFLQAANLFAEAGERLNREPPAAMSIPDLGTLDRELRAEQAFCLRFTGNSEHFARAERIYRELAVEAPNSPIPRFRLGQMCRDVEKYEDAAKLLEEAYTLQASTGEVLYPGIRYHLPRDLGYVHWRLSEAASDFEQRREHLNRAAQLTDEALSAAAPEDREEIIVARNNLLYYLLDLRELEAGEAERDTLAIRIRDLMAQLEAEPGYENWREVRLDTLMRAEHLYGEHDKACRLARIVLNRLRTKLGLSAEEPRFILSQRQLQTLSSDEQDMLRVSQHILAEA